MFGILGGPKRQPLALPSTSGQNVEGARSTATFRPNIDLAKERVRTFIATDALITGDLKLMHGAQIDGGLVGNLTFGIRGGLCIIEEGASVHGNITGPKALVLGTVCGDITVEGKLVIGPKAAVMGVIECGLLVVQEGAQLGESLIRVGRPTSREASRKSKPHGAQAGSAASDNASPEATIREHRLAVV